MIRANSGSLGAFPRKLAILIGVVESLNLLSDTSKVTYLLKRPKWFAGRRLLRLLKVLVIKVNVSTVPQNDVALYDESCQFGQGFLILFCCSGLELRG